MAESQILKNTRATLEVVFSIGDADGTVTVTITKADGSTLVSGASATHQGSAGSGDYIYVLAPQTELDYLTATWTGTFGGVVQSVQTFAEIVGGYLFAVSDARTFGDRTLANATTYPDADIRAMREEITDMFQQVCGVSFIPRFARDTLDGTGTDTIQVWNTPTNRIITASIDGAAMSGSDLTNTVARRSGLLIRKNGAWNWGYGGRNVIVAYEHGYSTVPPDIQRAALTLVRYQLVSSDISDRMVSFENDLGAVRLSVPGPKFPTGIPIVDSTLARYSALTSLLP